MKIPDSIPFDNRQDYRDGYRDGYAGLEGTDPIEFDFARFLNGKTMIPLSTNHPKYKAYWKGWEDGHKKFSKLKGGI